MQGRFWETSKNGLDAGYGPTVASNRILRWDIVNSDLWQSWNVIVSSPIGDIQVPELSLFDGSLSSLDKVEHPIKWHINCILRNITENHSLAGPSSSWSWLLFLLYWLYRHRLVTFYDIQSWCFTCICMIHSCLLHRITKMSFILKNDYTKMPLRSSFWGWKQQPAPYSKSNQRAIRCFPDLIGG